MKKTPFWWEGIWPIDIPVSTVPAHVDTLIVGAGYTGLSAALALLRGGRSVAVIEAARVGEGASSRNGGMCGDQLKPSFDELTGRFGRSMAVRLLAEARDALAFFYEFVEANEIRCDCRKSGRITGALSEKQFSSLRQESEKIRREVGVEYDVVERADLHRELETDAYVGGRVYPQHGGINPAKYVSELGRRVVEAGGAIHQLTRLLSFERRAEGFRCVTTAGATLARDLILATNGYSGKASPALERRLVPVTSYMIATNELSPAVMDAIMPRRRMVTDTNRLLCYYRPSPDGRRVLFGGRPAYTEISMEASAARLMSYLQELFPRLKDATVGHSWFGLIAYTFDRLPHIGEIDGAHYAGGYCGSGVAMSTWLGNKLAQTVLGRSEGESAFAQIGHPTSPFYFGTPWFLPVVQAWYQVSDVWDRSLSR